MSDAPILVSESPATSQLASALRDLLKVVGTLLAARGVFDASLVEPLLGVVMVLGTVLWSQAVVWIKHRRLKAMAAVLPDSIAHVQRRGET